MRTTKAKSTSGHQSLSKTLISYIRRNWSREQIVEFCLELLGEEARAWWARKETHQG